MSSDSSDETSSDLSFEGEGILPQRRENVASWTCHPAFGIVHRHQCTTCRHYMAHFVDASQNIDDLSFHEAVKERDSHSTMSYLEGIREGRQTQAQHDYARMALYRDQRNDERAKIHHQEEEIHRLRMELLEMRDALVAMQLGYEEQTMALTLGTGAPERSGDGSEAYRIMNLQDALFTGSQNDYSLEGKGKGKEVNLGDWGDHEGSPSSHSNAAQGMGELGVDSTSQSEGRDSSSDDWDSSVSSSPRSSTSDESLVVVVDGEHHHHDATLQEVQSLMALAHGPNQTEALARVKALCAEAHRTPRGLRTEVHKYVLEAWRNPEFLRCPGMPLPAIGGTPASLPSIVPEVFVDASGSGIGFSMNGRWLAWNLNKRWKVEGRDINWAELVAVELGLRTAIAIGVNSTHLRLRSDSQSVIEALKTHQIRRLHDKTILDEILALCQAHDIVLRPCWVWTKENPADAPSRGRYPPTTLRIGTAPEIPAHLQPFVQSNGAD